MNITITSLIIDARTRELKVFSANVTEDKNKKLVIRKAVKVGGLKELVECGILAPASLPIFVIGEYRAEASGGFTRQVGSENFMKTEVVAGKGFGYYSKRQKKTVGNSLRIFKKPMTATVCPKGTNCSVMEQSRSSSGWQDAEALRKGVEMISILKRKFVLIEGDGRGVNAFEFNRPKGEIEYPEFSIDPAPWVYDQDVPRKKQEEAVAGSGAVEGEDYNQYLDPEYAALLMSESAQDAPQGS